MPKLEVQSQWLYPKPGKKQYANAQYKKLIPLEITTDNSELKNKKPLNESKGKDGTHILNSRRSKKAKGEGKFLRELQQRQG